MPHLTITYTPNLNTDMAALCNALATGIGSIADENGESVFPVAGTRVMAFKADHASENAFAYLNLRIAPGRPASVIKHLGETLQAIAASHFAAELSQRPMGLTLQIDEGAEVYGGKFGNLHAQQSQR